jgi:hypothetical protein
MFESWGVVHKRYSGRVGILASGPSVGSINDETLSLMPFICVKGAIAKFSGDICPLVYVFDDFGALIRDPSVALTGVQRASFSALPPECVEKLVELFPGEMANRRLLPFVRLNRGYRGASCGSDRSFAWSIRNDPDFVSTFSLFRSKPNRIGFSKNVSRGYFGARTVTYWIHPCKTGHSVLVN